MLSWASFESNVNYDLGKTVVFLISPSNMFESNVNYDLGKTTGYFVTPGA